ncbi:PPOX class F420-dependent oxidoreductase [Mycobacterium sp. Aquia_216]|uniref:PPOX class F420-dependent oxidoreductase n=1 Tax=Mycobacterium sp. Aquia_216 TaxID=2991729 RepID=UPI00227A1B63|nr:PPOX class F420-dependent oxidoreductase [Mycobacterium sp. Aquia_216]WAJ45301.1 PPOX class F420-dependent oxidoreductase [Mycobacterium sp. Aquia_216]
MELNESARNLIGKGADATLVTLNPDGSPHATLVWVALQSTPDGDELVVAHLSDNKKVRNVRTNPRVAATIVSPGNSSQPSLWLSITGTARIVEGGAPELLNELAHTLCPDVDFVPEGAPPGFVTHIRIEKTGGVGPWGHG